MVAAAQVFELATDPHETNNLDGTRPLPADAARWLAEFHALCPRVAARPGAPGTGAIDPAVREKCAPSDTWIDDAVTNAVVTR